MFVSYVSTFGAERIVCVRLECMCSYVCLCVGAFVCVSVCVCVFNMCVLGLCALGTRTYYPCELPNATA